MIKFQFATPFDQPRPLTSHGRTSSLNVVSLGKTIIGFDGFNSSYARPDTHKAEKKKSARVGTAKFFSDSPFERPSTQSSSKHFVVKTKKRTNSYALNSHRVSSAVEQAPVEFYFDSKRETGNKFSSQIANIKLQGSLANLLTIPTKDNLISEANITTEKSAQKIQNERVDSQISINFRVTGVYNVPTSALPKSRQTSREKFSSNIVSIPTTNNRPEFAGRSKITSCKSTPRVLLLQSERGSVCPRTSPAKANANDVSHISGKEKTPLQGLEDYEEDVSQTLLKGYQRGTDKPLHGAVSANNIGLMQNLKHGRTRSATSIKEINSSQFALERKASLVKALKAPESHRAESKVSEKQRERLATFIKDDFVNDLIFTKYYKVMDEDQKMAAINTLKQQMADHKNIRTKYFENMNVPYASFFEQYGKEANQVVDDVEHLNQGESRDHSPALRQFKTFEISSPRNSATVDTKSRLLFGATGFVNNSPSPDRKKDSDFYVNMELLKTVTDEKKKKKKLKTARSSYNPYDQVVREKYVRVRRLLKENLFKCVDMKVTADELLSKKKIFPMKAYERQGSYAFLKAAKYGDHVTIIQYLDQDRFYVLEYDAIKQTALHWAAKRGNLYICQLLLEKGAYADALDLGGRTPLYYAMRSESPEIVRILLYAKASPWSPKGLDYNATCKDRDSMRYLTKARHLNILLNFFPTKDRLTIWKNEVDIFLAPIQENEMERVSLAQWL